LIIKPIESTQDIKKVAAVDAEIWGKKPEVTVPEHILTAVARDGGVLLGAFQDDQLIGFTLGWLGTIDPSGMTPAANQLKLISHMTGVQLGYRDRRIGYQLKLAQREWALTRGLDLITWTYDPLESRNGYFNIHLLGSVCQTYLQDYYGEMPDKMNAGIPSDRFRVDWWINSTLVDMCVAGKRESYQDIDSILSSEEPRYQMINPIIQDNRELIYPTKKINPINSEVILVEIPPDFQEIRRRDLRVAHDWRIQTRDIFEESFRSGYQVFDFIYQRKPYPRSFYLLKKRHEN
jgi:predicted GNAT superfamily acetyltransferase